MGALGNPIHLQKHKQIGAVRQIVRKVQKGEILKFNGHSPEALFKGVFRHQGTGFFWRSKNHIVYGIQRGTFKALNQEQTPDSLS